MDKVKSRMKEPSTWVAFSVLLSFFGFNVAPEIVVQTGVGLGAILGVVLAEKK